MTAHRMTVWGLVLAGALLSARALAQETEAESATIDVWTIRATKSNDEISKRLEPLAEKLKATFKFTGYKLVRTDSRAVELGKELKADLISPFDVVITAQERTDDQIKLKVLVRERKGDKVVKLLSTTVSLRRERFQLFGGWKLPDGDVLILAISAK
jgi:hypothetical protein